MAQSNSRLVQQQSDFALALAKLLIEAGKNDKTVTLGEVLRPSILARWYARIGIGIAASQHSKNLAVDLRLYVEGVYQTKTPDYRWLGERWERLDKRARWGGRFMKPDGNHFEFINP